MPRKSAFDKEFCLKSCIKSGTHRKHMMCIRSSLPIVSLLKGCAQAFIYIILLQQKDTPMSIVFSQKSCNFIKPTYPNYDIMTRRVCPLSATCQTVQRDTRRPVCCPWKWNTCALLIRLACCDIWYSLSTAEKDLPLYLLNSAAWCNNSPVHHYKYPFPLYTMLFYPLLILKELPKSGSIQSLFTPT